MGNHILVVDDDQTFRTVLKGTLEDLGHTIETASDGTTAQTALEKGAKFDLVLSDVRMPKMTGLELLKWIRTKETMPVVLMTGYSEILDSTQAFDNGANGFLFKPFTELEVNEVIGDAVVDTQRSEDQDLDQKFARVSIEDFVSGKTIPYNIYIRLSAKKYIKVAASGVDLHVQRLKAYRSKGARHLYLTREDFRAYLATGLEIGKKLVDAPQIDVQRKKHFLRHAGEVLAQKIEVDGIDQQSFHGAKDFLETTLGILADDAELLDLIQLLDDHSDHLYAHSLGVALYSILIARQMGWRATPTTFRVGMAGLFHDVGQKDLDRSILEKKRPLLTKQERDLLESHPIRGAELLRLFPQIPEEVAQATLRHHELLNGFGYPSHLKGDQIMPLARLITVADVFCDHVLKNPTHPRGMSAPLAIAQMNQFKREGIDPTYFAALQKLVKSQ